jgi:hypothetical protein
MNTFINTCNKIESELLQVKSKCQVMLQELTNFNDLTIHSLHIWTLSRLSYLALKIKTLEASLYLQHANAGLVYATLNEAFITVRWTEYTELLENKDLYKGGNTSFVSINNCFGIIGDLKSKVESGNLTEAIIWLNNHPVYEM